MRLADADATGNAGAVLGSRVARGDVIALSGSLGAGKTTFARGLIGALGFEGEVPSPTFGIVIPYAPPDVRLPVWHVDLYRIEDPGQIAELGLDDARIDAVLIIEWPERMGASLWADALRIDFVRERDARRLTAKVPASWEARWPFR